MKRQKMGQLCDLEGMPKRVPGWWASSRTQAMVVLKKRGLVTAAGDNGALTVWKHRKGRLKGRYSAEFCRYMVPHSTEVFVRLYDVRAWLKKWWPHMGRG